MASWLFGALQDIQSFGLAIQREMGSQALLVSRIEPTQVCSPPTGFDAINALEELLREASKAGGVKFKKAHELQAELQRQQDKGFAKRVKKLANCRHGRAR